MDALNQAIKVLQPSITLALSQKARDLKEKGYSVVDMSVGEPDFPTPEFVKTAAIAAINENKTFYTAVDGISELKQAIIEKYKREHNVVFNPNQICVSNGAKQSIFNVFSVTLNPQDEVILPAPYWPTYHSITSFFGGVSKVVECGPDQYYKITPQQLEECITEKTKWIVLTSPNNPTGSIYSKHELEELLKILNKYPHIQVMTDEIYDRLDFEGAFCSFSTLMPLDRLCVINGVSKSFSMTGWRIGYVIGNEKLVAAVKRIQSQSTSNPCSISQYAAVAALNAPHNEYFKKTCLSFKERRDFFVRFINEKTSLKCHYIPQGAFYAYVSCADFLKSHQAKRLNIASSNDLCEHFLTKGHVATVPGEGFGLLKHIRFSYAVSDDELKIACERIRQCLEA